MEEIKFGKKNEPSFFLKKSDDLLAVRTRSKKPLASLTGSPAATSAVSDGALVMQFADAGLDVFKIPPGGTSLRSRKAALRSCPDVRFAGSVLVDPKTGEPTIYTENLFIKFIDSLDSSQCTEILRGAGLTVKKSLDYATNAYFVATAEGSGTQVFTTALDLLKRSEVEYCHPEILRQRSSRGIHPNQWHLKKTTVSYQVDIDASANVEAAHRLSEGEGIVIAVIDDGVDIDHPEFKGQGKIVAPQNFGGRGRRNDPRPQNKYASHGTPVAGVACASGKYGASGVAPKAKLMPIRLAADLGSVTEAEAFLWAANNGADVIVCSWGPPDGDWADPSDPMHDTVFPLSACTRLAIDYAVTKGRKGKGCAIFFAAGNGNESVDNDGYASYANVMAVAACNDHSRRSVYSDYGKAVWFAFPSSDLLPFDKKTRGIWTTDRLGNKGDNEGSIGSGDQWGNYTDSFGGTSSACPGAAGVAALILAVNPALRWNEIRNILAKTCDKIDDQLEGDGAYNKDGHSPLYGYGRLNAGNAVKLALEVGVASQKK
jgi:hypothetical protein